jgi:hypothetical protein
VSRRDTLVAVYKTMIDNSTFLVEVYGF